jgi:protein-disulfide isomerase
METKNNFSVPIAIVLAGIVIAAAIYFNDGRKVEPVTPVKNNQAQIVDIKNVKIEGQPFIGSPTAPVTIAYWFDYQCPACKYHEENFMSPLVEEYVKAGKVKVVFKDFAFLGLPKIPDSNTLAITARAVWEAYPDKFYEWHKTIFTNQGEENTGWATKEVIASLALNNKILTVEELKNIDGLIAKNSAKYLSAIAADKAEGSRFGVNSTPSMIIGTELAVGAPRYYKDFVAHYIDVLLK